MRLTVDFHLEGLATPSEDACAPAWTSPSASPAGDEAELVAPLRPGKHSMVRNGARFRGSMGLPQVRRQCCAGGQSSTANAWRSNLLSGYAQQAAKVLGTQGPRRSGARLRLLLGYTLPRSLSVDSFYAAHRPVVALSYFSGDCTRSVCTSVRESNSKVLLLALRAGLC